MEFECIKDQNGKDHLAISVSEFNTYEPIGDKLEDFEYLQFLGEGGFGSVYKVLSLVNKKIYAMKVLDLAEDGNSLNNISKEKKLKYFISEIEILKSLNHPNIVKYYKTLEIKSKFYVIMEYFDNGDLETYIKAKKEQNSISKEDIWNFFYQCISGLNYLHSHGIIHRDLKPKNIFMKKNKIFKIGDFGISALIEDNENYKNIHINKNTKFAKDEYSHPEENKYDKSTDIYALGCIFYEISHLKTYQKLEYVKEDGIFNRKLLQREISKDIDSNIIEIISEMVENKQKTEYIFKIIEENYYKEYIKNSGLYSVIRCIINLPYIIEHFLKEYKNSLTNKNKIYSQMLLFFIENAYNDNWIRNLIFYRKKIIEENNLLNNNKEINLYLILSFILNKLHGELNQVDSNQGKGLNKNMNEEEYFISFNSNFKSIISQYFGGHVKCIRNCCKCKTRIVSFSYFFSLEFELNVASFLKKGAKEIDLLELFQIQNSISLHLRKMGKLACKTCKKFTEHKESKIFYQFPYQLVLYFDRGSNHENNLKINYPEKLDISSISKEQKYSPNLFDLVGIIKRIDINGGYHYISLILNYNDKKWYLCDNEKIEKINSYSDHNDGDIMMLFYHAKK